MPQPRQHLRLRVACVAALAAAGALLLLLFPPEQYHFYPRCPVYEIFGLLCPGCGGTRALAAMLHGHFAEAFHSNALVTLAAIAGAPAAGLYALAASRWPEQAARARGGRWQQPLAGAGLVLATLFTLWRNWR